MKILWKNMRLLIVVLLLHGYASAGEVVDQVYKKKTIEGSKDRPYSVFLPEDQCAGEALHWWLSCMVATRPTGIL
jgi:hypothetical protein